MKINHLIVITIINFQFIQARNSFKEFVNLPGIFYEHLGDAKLNTDTWTLLSSTNISFSENRLFTLADLILRTVHLCQSYPYKRNNYYYCDQSIRLLQNTITRISSKFETISHLIGHSSNSRSRRGLINGGSYVFKWIFGIPDADDAQYYSEAINQAQNDERNIQILMKQQIQVIKSTITNFNETVSNLRLNERILNDNIDKINIFMNELRSDNTNNELLSTITDHINLLNELTYQMETEFDNLISAILFAKRNILHPSIITPKHLLQELRSARLPIDREFPVLNEFKNIFHYIDICKINAVFTDGILIFSIKIPLVHSQKFRLYRLIPFPTPSKLSENLYHFIQPSFEYLLISNLFTRYCKISKIENCLEINEGNYLCQNLVIYQAKENSICETKLLTSSTNQIPSDCSLKTIKIEAEIWEPIVGNEWIFILSKPTKLAVECTNNTFIEDIQLPAVGILNLQPDCRGYTRNTILSAKSEIRSNYQNIFPMIDINRNEYINHYANNTNIQNLQAVQLTNLHSNELKLLSHKLDQYDEILQNTINHDTFISKFSWIRVIINIILGILFLFIICKIIKFYQNYCICRRRPLAIRETTITDEPENINCGCFRMITECIPGIHRQPTVIRSQIELQDETYEIPSTSRSLPITPNPIYVRNLRSHSKKINLRSE